MHDEPKQVSLNYADLFDGRDPTQITLIECMLSYTCNIRCAYCFNPHHRRGKEMSAAEWHSALDQAAALGAVASIFNGGEPLAYPDWPQVIPHARDLGLVTGISSNGLLLDAEKVRKLAACLDVLQISLHPWRYIDALSENIEPFVDHIKRFKDLGGRRAVLKVVMYRGLTEHISRILDVITEQALGLVDSVGVQAALPLGQGYADRSSMPTFAEVREANDIVEMYALTSDLPLENGLFDHFTVRPNIWGRHGVIISPEGEVYPLVEAIEMLSVTFGAMTFDSLRSDTLETIWSVSPTMNRFRGTEWHKEPCRSCRLRNECRGGSRLNAYVIAKDLHAADPFCVLSPDHRSLMEIYQR